MASFTKQPPVLQSEEVYTEWKQDINVWSIFTDLPKEKQGPAVYLSLPQNIRECVRHLDISDIGRSDGLNIIINKLDEIYLRDENTMAYMAFKEFYSYKRDAGVNINDFLVRYEFLYQKLHKHGITLPEGVQAFFVLNAANVSEDNEKLARTTCGNLTYAAMKDTLKRVFSNVTSLEFKTVPAIKEEIETVNFNRQKTRVQNFFPRNRTNPTDRQAEGVLLIDGPRDQGVQVKSNATFFCKVYDTNSTGPNDWEPFMISWTFQPLVGNPEIIMEVEIHKMEFIQHINTNTNKYSTSNGYELHINSVNFSDAGNYTCTLNVSQEMARASLSVLGKYNHILLRFADRFDHHRSRQARECLEIKKEKPQCFIPPMPLMVNVETRFNCSVSYAGNRAPHLEWYHGPDVIEADNNVTGFTVSSSLIVSATRDKNGHIFTCYAKYEEQTFTTYCQTMPPLNIYFPVSVKTVYLEPRKKDNLYPRGTDVYLHCVAFGNPAPDYHWVYTSPDGRNHFVLSQLNYYRIRNIQRGDEGNYSCKVTNKYSGRSFYDEELVQIRISDSHRRIIRPSAKRSYNQKYSMTYISPYTIGAVISSSLAVILIIIFIVLAVRLRAKERKIREKLARSHDENLDDQEVELLDENIQPTHEDMGDFMDSRHGWEMPRRFIKLHDLMGKGIYTEVWKGRMQKHPTREDMVRVAIKRLMVEATEKEKKFFLEEMEVLKMLPPHQNVIHMIGCYTLHEPQLIVLEYAAEGTLRNYLQRHRIGQQEIEITQGQNQSVRLRNHTLTPQKMFSLATQVIRGMEHLQRFKLISYRLTSASILVTRGGVVRLSGFGFPDDVMARNLYEATSLPVRWMSPESIQERLFNLPADIWSFGVIFWEIIHFGMTPYPTMGPQEVSEKVVTGYRMPQPPQCSAELYGLLLSCWQSVPANRPSLEELHHLMKNMSRVHSDHILFEKMPEYQRSSPYDQLDSDL